jgi:hypothetical protein
MKKITLLLIGLIFMGSISIYAQDEIDYFSKKNEINVQVDNIFGGSDLGTILLLDGYSEMGGLVNHYFKIPTVGLGYKRHIGIGAIRVKASWATMAHRYNVNENSDAELEYALHQESFSAGWEFHSTMRRTQVFFGADFVLNMQATTITDYYYANNTSTERTDKSARIGFGFQPFLGFKYFISPNFSVSSEYHFLAEFYNGETIRNADADNEVTLDNHGYSAQFGPLGQITFSFHF